VNKPLITCLWLLPVLLHSEDARAWGLYTHVYYAQLLLWAVPLADPRFRRAVRRFPELLLSGACLPDVSLFSGWVGSHNLSRTHQWSVAHRLLHEARDDREAALATGFACHLLSDIVAHNYFVPEYESRWGSQSRMAVHAASEWAMDAHLDRELFARPGQLLGRYLPEIAGFAAHHFGAEPGLTRRALRYLMLGERLLRGASVHRLAYRGAQVADRAAPAHFDQYAGQTAERLLQINRLIAGDAPSWEPEPEPGQLRADRRPVESRHHSLMLPQDFFVTPGGSRD
jgi:hypothetical protein